MLEILQGKRYDVLHTGSDIYVEASVQLILERHSRAVVAYLCQSKPPSYFLEYVFKERGYAVDLWPLVRALVEGSVGVKWYRSFNPETWPRLLHPTKRRSLLYYAVKANNVEVVRSICETAGEMMYEGDRPALLFSLMDKKYSQTALVMIDSPGFRLDYPTEDYVRSITKESYFLVVMKLIEKMVPFTQQDIKVLDNLGFTRKRNLTLLAPYFLHRLSAIRMGLDPEMTVAKTLLFRKFVDRKTTLSLFKTSKRLDLYGQDAYGLYFLSYIKTKHVKWTVKLLEKHGYDPFKCGYGNYFFDLIQKDGAGMVEVKKFLKKGMDVNTQQQDTGYTALHYAIRKKDHTLVGFLLKAGASPHFIASTGETALIMAHQYDLRALIFELRAHRVKYYAGNASLVPKDTEFHKERHFQMREATLVQLIFYKCYNQISHLSFWETKYAETLASPGQWVPKVPVRWIYDPQVDRLIWIDKNISTRGAIQFDEHGKANDLPDEKGRCFMTRIVTQDLLILERNVVNFLHESQVVSRTVCRRLLYL